MAVQLDEGQVIFLGPGEGESIPGEHRDFVVKAEREELEVIEFSCDPEFGPVPPHIHPDKVDSFFILEGELEFTIGDKTVRAGPGAYVAAPPGVRHGFRNPGPGRARFLNVHAPSDGFIERVRREAQPETEDQMNPRARYDEIADDLAARDPNVELTQMMGMPCIKSGGKMVIGYERTGEMVFKLPDDSEHEKALGLDGAKLFDPSGKGKPFKEWVQVPYAHESEWSKLASTALKLRAG